jgi:hypothetical protein
VKFDRLLSIVLLLQHRDLVPAKELAAFRCRVGRQGAE